MLSSPGLIRLSRPAQVQPWRMRLRARRQPVQTNALSCRMECVRQVRRHLVSGGWAVRSIGGHLDGDLETGHIIPPRLGRQQVNRQMASR